MVSAELSWMGGSVTAATFILLMLLSFTLPFLGVALPEGCDDVSSVSDKTE